MSFDKRELYVKSVKIRSDEIPTDSYLAKLPLAAIRDAIELDCPVTFITGENGVGKSTLIEAIAVSLGCNPEGGSRNMKFSTNYTVSDLHEHMVVAKGTRKPRDMFFLRSECLYNMYTYIDELDSEPSFDPKLAEAYGGVSLHERSHGQSIMSIMNNRFFGHGLYILDEPEVGLSPQTQLSMIYRICELVRNDSQFIIATHSPFLIAAPDAAVYELTFDGISRTDYKETALYRDSRGFLENPERVLHYLLKQ